jgi:alkanesulfonate monooxygenase SsuD/methylene tetrahydromethanopterin reductase-like flavin-dependent oxidoreductase (luciferase family)
MALDLSRMGFGITGSLSHDIVRELAPRVEEAGFRTLWINHGGDGGDSLASMQVAASVTMTLRFATGVIPVDRMPAAEIVASFREKDLPVGRTTIGIGASKPPSPLDRVRDAASMIAEQLGVPVVVGALGPRMRRLGVRETDGVLLNWLTPDGARQAMEDKAADVSDLPDHEALVALYIRCALGQGALPILEREAARYEGIPSYAANFRRLGFSAIESAVYATDGASLRSGLEPFLGVVDEPVVRAITATDSLADYLALVDAVAG